MFKVILAAPAATSWYGGPSSYDDQTLHMIGVVGAILIVGTFAWILRMFATSGAYDEYGRTRSETPLWVYIGLVALFLGLSGAINMRTWAPNPPFLIMLAVGLPITILALATGRLRLNRSSRR
jgi:hypothetical protein